MEKLTLANLSMLKPGDVVKLSYNPEGEANNLKNQLFNGFAIVEDINLHSIPGKDGATIYFRNGNGSVIGLDQSALNGDISFVRQPHL